MPQDEEKKEGLESAVVRICPACGVVNPAGPSETCPHLQLARFDGLDPELADLLAEVAESRRRFSAGIAELKHRVLKAIRNRDAEVETPRTARFSEVENLRQRPAAEGAALTLQHPPLKRAVDTPTKKRQRKRATQPRVDPRQLELIAREPSKGDA